HVQLVASLVPEPEGRRLPFDRRHFLAAEKGPRRVATDPVPAPPARLDQGVPGPHRRAAPPGRDGRTRGAAGVLPEERAAPAVLGEERAGVGAQRLLAQHRPVLDLLDRALVACLAARAPLLAVVGNVLGGVPQLRPQPLGLPGPPLVRRPTLPRQRFLHQPLGRRPVAPEVQVASVDGADDVLEAGRRTPVEGHQRALDAHAVPPLREATVAISLRQLGSTGDQSNVSALARALRERRSASSGSVTTRVTAAAIAAG